MENTEKAGGRGGRIIGISVHWLGIIRTLRDQWLRAGSIARTAHRFPGHWVKYCKAGEIKPRRVKHQRHSNSRPIRRHYQWASAPCHYGTVSEVRAGGRGP